MRVRRRPGLWVLRYWRDRGCSRVAGRQIRRLVLWRADVPMNEVFADLVHHHLHRLGFILRVDPDGFVEIHSFLAEWIAINTHRPALIHPLPLCPPPPHPPPPQAPHLPP